MACLSSQSYDLRVGDALTKSINSDADLGADILEKVDTGRQLKVSEMFRVKGNLTAKATETTETTEQCREKRALVVTKLGIYFVH